MNNAVETIPVKETGLSTSGFIHFIITLFNLKNFLDGPVDDEKWEKWTTDRIKIFKKFCLPSVRKQSNQNFKWLLYFDSRTPDIVLQSFKNDLNYENIEIILKNGFEEFYQTYTNDLKNRTPDNINWIAQSRFDNDDILNYKAIQYIQSNFKKQQEFIISLSSGYTYQINTGYLSHYYYPMSPFITLIENKNIQMKGVYFCNHWQWPTLRLWIFKEILNIFKLRNEKVHFVLIPRLWIQLIHNSNMHNTSDRGLPVFRNINLTEFNENLSSKPSPFFRVFSHIHYVWWKRYFKSALIRVFRILFSKPD